MTTDHLRNTAPSPVQQAKAMFQEALLQAGNKGFILGEAHGREAGNKDFILGEAHGREVERKDTLEAFYRLHGATPAQVVGGFHRGVEWGEAQAVYIGQLEATVRVLRSTIHELHEDLDGLSADL